MSSVVPKTVSKSGIRRGIVPFTRPATLLASRYASCQEFDLQKWIRRFRSIQTSHIDRLGMIRSISFAELNLNQKVILLRSVILDWADGADFSHFDARPGAQQHPFLLIRYEAWMYLSNFMKGVSRSDFQELVKIEAFLEDMKRFFSLQRLHHKNIENSENPFGSIGNPRSPIVLAGEGIRDISKTFIRTLFVTEWGRWPDYTDDPDSASRKEEARKWNLFISLARIDVDLTPDLLVHKESFELVTARLCLATGTDSLEQIAPDSFNEEGADMYSIARRLIALASGADWLRVKGVLDERPRA